MKMPELLQLLKEGYYLHIACGDFVWCDDKMWRRPGFHTPMLFKVFKDAENELMRTINKEGYNNKYKIEIA